MADAFGVQNQIRATGIPMGTSVIAQEFSPGRPEPTLEQVVQQQTQDMTRISLRTGFYSNGSDGGDQAANQGEVESARQLIYDEMEELQNQTERDARNLRSLLSGEIADRMVEIETGFRSITVRIRERGSFGSGSASLNDEFLPVLDQLRRALTEIDGQVAIEGHTDNRPISTTTIPTNWHLSSLRALSVTHALVEETGIDSDRFQVIGYADSRPVATNDTAHGRAQNRRVEIVIRQGVDEELVRNLEEVEGVGSGSFESWFENYDQQ